MVRILTRPVILTLMAIALDSCGDWKMGAGIGYGNTDGVLTCSVTDRMIGPECGNANIYLCNNNDSAKKVSVTRRFAFGEPHPVTEVYTTPAKANTLNNLAWELRNSGDFEKSLNYAQ